MALTSKQWHKIVTTTFGALLAVVSLLLTLAGWVVKGIAEDVAVNTKHAQVQEGAQLDTRLGKVEVAVNANRTELRLNRQVLNSIAEAIPGATPAGPVEPLPEESE